MALESFYNFFLRALSKDGLHTLEVTGKTKISEDRKDLDVSDEECPPSPFVLAMPGSFRESRNIPNVKSPQTPIPPQSALPDYKLLKSAQISPEKALSILTELLCEQIDERLEKKGFIYVLSGAHYPGALKVGVTTDPSARYAAHKRICDPDYVLVVVKEVLHAKRIEKVIQAEFKRSQVKMICKKSCGTEHLEWFKVSEEVLLEAIDKWASFSHQKPYTPVLEDGGGGKLRDDVELPLPANRELLSPRSRKSTPRAKYSRTLECSCQVRQRSSRRSPSHPDDSPSVRRTTRKVKEIVPESSPREDVDSLSDSDLDDLDEISLISRKLTSSLTMSERPKSSMKRLGQSLPIREKPVRGKPASGSPLAMQSTNETGESSSVADLYEGLASLSLTSPSGSSPPPEISTHSKRRNIPRHRGTHKGFSSSLQRSPQLTCRTKLSDSKSEDQVDSESEEESYVCGVSSFSAKMAAQGKSM